MRTLKAGVLARVLARFAVGLLVVALAGCATAPQPVLPAPPLLDAQFAPPAELPDASAVFTLSAAMRDYADRELRSVMREANPRRALIDALYGKRLRLVYDASTTRNASEAFAAQSGNCLSLVIMTASFARHLGMPVSFQSVQTDDFYSRSGGLTLVSGHVNLVLDAPPMRQGFARSDNTSLTIDFLPQEELRGLSTRPLDAATIVAMYFNNRAAELLAAGRPADAYWFARAAVLHAPAFTSALNTLGVIYSRAGQPAAAEEAFRHTLLSEPRNVATLSNLVQLLQRQDRQAEADTLALRLEQLQPVAPFRNFNLGRAAMAAGDFAQARDLFLRELRLQPYQDEVHFWAAQAYWQLGRPRDAMRHLSRALDNSSSPDSHDRYAAKLEAVRHAPVQ